MVIFFFVLAVLFCKFFAKWFFKRPGERGKQKKATRTRNKIWILKKLIPPSYTMKNCMSCMTYTAFFPDPSHLIWTLSKNLSDMCIYNMGKQCEWLQNKNCQGKGKKQWTAHSIHKTKDLARLPPHSIFTVHGSDKLFYHLICWPSLFALTDNSAKGWSSPSLQRQSSGANIHLLPHIHAHTHTALRRPAALTVSSYLHVS